MANRIYNVKKVETVKATVGATNTDGTFAYKGFNSRNVKGGFRQYDIDLIKQDLLNHFNIKRGEKLENPEFGTIIWEMLYEPMDDTNLKLITEDVEKIVNRDPRTAVESLKVDATDQGIRIEVNLRYIQYNLTESMSITFDKANLPTT